MNRKQMGKSCLLFVATILFSTLFSACNLNPDTSKEDIRLVVESYFKDLTSGKLEKDQFESEFALDAPFQDLDIEDDESEKFMLSGIQASFYEVGEIVSSVADATGTCEVRLKALDLDSIIQSIDGGRVTRAAFEEALADPFVVKKNNMLSLDLSYDETEKKWSIVDTRKVVDVLGTPYVDLVFEPNPYEAIDEFMLALINGDNEGILDSSYSMSYQSFYSDSAATGKIMAQYYKSLEYELGEENLESVEGEEGISVPITFSIVNLERIDEAKINEKEILRELYKIYIVAIEDNLEDDEINEQLMEYYAGPIIEAINSPDAMRRTYEGTISLVRSDNDERWVVMFVPDGLNGKDLIEVEPDQATSINSLIEALDELLADGSIDQETYDRYMYGDA